MIRLIATMDRHRVEWLPQFVDHYRGLGVQEFLISLHLSIDGTRDQKRELAERAERILQGAGLHFFSIVLCPFDHECFAPQHNAIRNTVSDENDWIVWADIDEFQEYPDSLEKILSICEDLHIPQIRGKFIDRVARSGTLPAFDPARSIWEQYPIGADVTARISAGQITKVVASKASLAISAGHHFITGKRTKVYPLEATIHHFKWDASVLERLRPRLAEEFKMRCGWWSETQRFFEHLERFGRIRLDMLQQAELGTPRPGREDLWLSSRSQGQSWGDGSGKTR